MNVRRVMAEEYNKLIMEKNLSYSNDYSQDEEY